MSIAVTRELLQCYESEEKPISNREIPSQVKFTKWIVCRESIAGYFGRGYGTQRVV